MAKARARSVDWCSWKTHRVNYWRRDHAGDIASRPFLCKSWRCPKCRPWVGLVDYARVAHALCSRDRWLYLVLTLEGNEHKRSDRWQLFRDAALAWRNRFLVQLGRDFGRIEYVQTWEQHASGVPHVNVVLRSDELLRESDRLGSAVSNVSRTGRPVLRIRSRLRSLARRSGFGRQFWIEETWTPKEGETRPLAGLASYLVKLARGLGIEDQERRRGESLASELVRSERKTGDQTPIAAPVGFRRLRASHGLLAPRYRGDPELTGRLGPASDPPWSWRLVENVESLKTAKITEAFRMLEDLDQRGLPQPPALRRFLARCRRAQADTRRTGSAPSAGRCSPAGDSPSIGSTTTRFPQARPTPT